ncbi:MAG: capsular biosynthesis protein [Sulfobacillus acidophilus]|uniref:Capsular biosynthesis protein n=1 Tax=Sulfobacillus acidophilus TaxID=53633 RepID=A0A2T2WI16_9FIRM|nr:MAG: capsular biosynthesis protein [Sulfobacillus acidophilus]
MLFGLASLIAGLFNYLYHVLLAHVLGPDRYGDLATFLDVTAFLVLPGPVITLLYTRLGRRDRKRAPRESWLLWLSGSALWIFLMLCSPALARMLHVSALLLIVFTLEVVPSLALAANIGILQRVRRYLWVGFLTVLVAAFRVVAATMAAVFHVYPLFFVGLLEGFAAFVAFAVSRGWATKAPWVGETSKAGVISGTAVVGVINVVMAIADGLLAKHVLNPLAAGQYMGMATIGHTVQFLSGSFGTVMLTSIIAAPSRRLRFLGLTVGVYAGLAGVAESIFLARGVWVISVVLGRHFIPVVAWLSYYGWGMIALGLINIAMLYSVALKRWEAIATTALGLVIWLWRLAVSHNIGALTRATTVTMGATLLVTAVVVLLVELQEDIRGERVRA